MRIIKKTARFENINQSNFIKKTFSLYGLYYSTVKLFTDALCFLRKSVSIFLNYLLNTSIKHLSGLMLFPFLNLLVQN